ncbi:hypothetical protein TrVE_jg4707 [Triparma verrucosa]|uniref:Uncharacterized protein n=1 Tax=Triparma verrucosa TaxID=1606542 RepID=A0A9W7C8G6_9STRA|nr:hypothetical protein TrVE_jg4707 [Triparma verrucosa]
MPLCRVNSSYPPSPSPTPWYGPGIYATSSYTCPPQTSTHSIYYVSDTITLRSEKNNEDTLLMNVKSNKLGSVNDVINPSIKSLTVIEPKVTGLSGLMNIRSSSPLPSPTSSSSHPRNELIHVNLKVSIPITPIFSTLTSDNLIFSSSEEIYSFELKTYTLKRVELKLSEGCTIRGLKFENGSVIVGVGKLNDEKNFDAWRLYDVIDVPIDLDPVTSLEEVSEGMRSAVEMEKRLEGLLEETRKMKEENVRLMKEKERIDREEKEGKERMKFIIGGAVVGMVGLMIVVGMNRRKR